MILKRVTLTHSAIYLISLFALGTISDSANAQVLIHPRPQADASGLDADIVLSLSEVDYDADRGHGGKVDRTILGGALSFPLAANLDLYGELGYIAEAELSNSNDDGDGVVVGGGVRALLFQQNQLSIYGRGGFRFIYEDYGHQTDGEIAEIELGGIVRYDLGGNLGVYGGLDAIPYSDGEIEVGNTKTDIERDDILGLRFGFDAKVQRVLLNAEIALISEEAFILRIGLPL